MHPKTEFKIRSPEILRGKISQNPSRHSEAEAGLRRLEEGFFLIAYRFPCLFSP